MDAMEPHSCKDKGPNGTNIDTLSHTRGTTPHPYTMILHTQTQGIQEDKHGQAQFSIKQTQILPHTRK